MNNDGRTPIFLSTHHHPHIIFYPLTISWLLYATATIESV
jgi:hypothetical protein